MKLKKAIELVARKGMSEPNTKWADLDWGNGLFTYALAQVIGYPGVIYAIDNVATLY